MIIKMIEDREGFEAAERLRCKVYDDEFHIRSDYNEDFNNNDLIILSAYVGDELVGSLYALPFLNRGLNIEQLFVKKEFQNNIDYRVGSSLLYYIEKHMDDIAQYKNITVSKLYISPSSDISERIYRTQGYMDTKLDGTLVKRI